MVFVQIILSCLSIINFEQTNVYKNTLAQDISIYIMQSYIGLIFGKGNIPYYLLYILTENGMKIDQFNNITHYIL